MKLSQLIAAQSSGALKVTDGPNGTLSVGGVQLSNEQCNQFLMQLGWLEWAKTPKEIITKTNSFINSFKRYIDNEELLNTADITFQNRRITDTLKYFDRIKLVGASFDVTILYGMPGVGGAYAVYDALSNTHMPEYTCRSAKQLVEFLNEAI